MKEYTHLNLDERKELFLMKKNEAPVIEIAQKLGKHRSVIYRELNRNTANKLVGYLPDEAHNLALERKAVHELKLIRYPELQEKVVSKLKDGWSPEVIAGRMKTEQDPLLVSHETIYQFVYCSEGKRLELFKHLLKGKPKRGKLYGRKVKKSIIPERVSIHDRPAIIATREEFGHLEGDLTFFAGDQSMNIGVIIERKTRFTRLILNPSKHTNLVIQGMFNELGQLPNFARKSITFDNGVEFTKHTLLKKCLEVDTYFCDKHSPWQKGQVEQMNSMLHRYLPKKTTNLNKVSYDQIKLIQNKLNNRPRKCIGFRTPMELFNEQLHQVVALRT